MKLVKDYYVQKVYHDVVVREINPDEVTSCTVKVNGKALKQGTDFSVNNVSESDGWHKYEYVISNAVFEKRGSVQYRCGEQRTKQIQLPTVM